METLVWNNQMLVSGIILVITFLGLFTEGIHGFHRAKFALAGAGAMIIAGQLMGFYNPERALDAIDWNVVFLLGSMMTIITIMIPTGGFQAIAFTIARFSRGRLFLLLTLMGTLVTVMSMLLDNVTTVVIFGPLIVLICQALKVSPIPYLLGTAILSNAGGVATLVGDPPNLMIGSAAGIGFNEFLAHMGGIVFCAWVGTLLALKLLFKRELGATPADVQMGSGSDLQDPHTWYASLGILALMIVGFVAHNALHWEPWMVSGLGLTLLVFLGRNVEMDHYFSQVELSMLTFFMALFIIVGGVEHSRFLEYVGQFILPWVQEDLLVACLLLLWVSAILSAMIDNIPFTAAMIPIILGLEQQGINVTPLWWALSAGVGMGGNGTHLGASANVFVVTLTEKLARETGDHTLAITPGLWFRKGTPVMLLTLAICSVVLILFFDFFSAPF